MNFIHAQTILSRRHSGKRKFSQNKGFPTVKGFTKKELAWEELHSIEQTALLLNSSRESFHLAIVRDGNIFFDSSCTGNHIKTNSGFVLERVLNKMTTWNTISPRCWLVAMWWHHFATFDDIILQHLMTSFWMTCTFWILNKQVKNSFLKLCTIFHRSSLDLDLDLDVV